MREPNDPDGKDFISDFRRFFGRGLAVLLPTVLTLWILVQAYFFVEAKVAEPINRGVRTVVLQVLPQVVENTSKLPGWYQVSEESISDRKRSSGGLTVGEIESAIRREQFKGYWDNTPAFRFIGLFVAVILIYLAGILLGGLIGRRVYKNIETFLTRLPVFNFVYPHVKQVVDLILGDKPMAFRRVVVIEYPRKGIWTIAFVTSNSMRTIKELAGGDVLSVFVPTSPAPFTGFTINVLASETRDLDLTVDEAVRFFITGGVLVPDRQATDAPDTIQESEPPSLPGDPGGSAPA